MAIQTAHAAVLARKNAGGPPAGCNTEQLNTNGSFDGLNDFTFYTWLATSFVSSGTFTACKGIARLDAVGTVPVGTLQFKIYTASAGSPGVLVGTASATVDRTSIVGEMQVEFSGLNASLTNGVTYFAILQASSTDGSGNGIRWIGSNTAQTIRGSTDGSSWDNLGTGTLNFKLNSV